MLNDLLRLTPEQRKITKIKFHKWNGSDDPIEVYKRDRKAIESWQYWHKEQRYFKEGNISIGLVACGYDHYLLTTADVVTGLLPVTNGVGYTYEPIPEYEKYLGRTIIRYHKTVRTQGILFDRIADQLVVSQILPDIFDDDDFPGYDRVKLSFPQLKSILDRGKKDWIAALENQKAVYLITDTSCGKLYVGSATSNNGMLLARWRAYAGNGHGGNKELIRIVDEKGIGYVRDHFQYSILENYNARTDDEVILRRESWWKDVLQSRQPNGYNDN